MMVGRDRLHTHHLRVQGHHGGDVGGSGTRACKHESLITIVPIPRPSLSSQLI